MGFGSGLKRGVVWQNLNRHAEIQNFQSTKMQNTCRQKHEWDFEVGLERGVVWQDLNRHAEKQNN